VDVMCPANRVSLRVAEESAGSPVYRPGEASYVVCRQQTMTTDTDDDDDEMLIRCRPHAITLIT